MSEVLTLLQEVLKQKWKLEGSTIITAEPVRGGGRHVVVVESVVPEIGEYIVERHNMNLLRQRILSPFLERQMA